MKIIENKIDGELPKSTVCPDSGEQIIDEWFFYFYEKKSGPLEGELIIPEGIVEIEKRAFAHLGVKYNVYRLPKSLKRLGENLIYYSYVKLIYPGRSEEFKSIATVREESVYESDGFDRYPYYSGGSRWVTHYHCFDSSTEYVEVYCEADGVTLLYGTRNRRDNEEPKIKGAD